MFLRIQQELLELGKNIIPERLSYKDRVVRQQSHRPRSSSRRQRAAFHL